MAVGFDPANLHKRIKCSQRTDCNVNFDNQAN